MKNYILPNEFREMEKTFMNIVRSSGRDYVRVFGSFLDYMIGFFSLNNPEVPDWTYKKEETAMFNEMMRQYFAIMQIKLKSLEWYDVFGDFFMDIVAPSSKQYNGQFFTPQTVCDFMAAVTVGEGWEQKEPHITCGAFGKRVVVNDAACGSGRLLLSARAKSVRDWFRDMYYVAEDIDLLCCKMTAINLCVHGCFGEVINHDSLTEPDKVKVGYIINEGLYPINGGLPTIRSFTDENRFVSIQIWKMRKEQMNNSKTDVAMENAAPKKPIQLSLF